MLTVVADESYATFAEGLQADIARDLEIRFGVVAARGVLQLA